MEHNPFGWKLYKEFPLAFGVIPQNGVSQMLRTMYPGFFFCSVSPSNNVKTENIVKEVIKRLFLVMTQRHFTFLE